MVLTIGSLAAGDSEDRSHDIYYARAKVHLDFELLGTGCMESLQALCLLAGYYLNYKNSPNMGYAILGAAFRIAIALGLHREPTKLNEIPESNWKPTTRRKIWWSLFCVDTYSSMTLGRTTLGRWDSETMNVSCFSDLEKQDPAVLSLNCAQGFCMIATRVQHRFAQFQSITTSEIDTYDSEVREWFQRLPDEWRGLEPGPPRSQLAKYVLHSRYHTFRLLLFRPFLLSYANKNVPFSSLKIDEQKAINKCQEIACEAIDHIVFMTHTLDRLRVWSAAWFLYQATLVALLSVIIHPDHQESGRLRNSIEKALVFFEKLSPWSATAVRSKQLIARIYDTRGLSSSTVYNMVGESFDIALFHEMGLDIFNEGWHWDTSYWLDYLAQYPGWTGE